MNGKEIPIGIYSKSLQGAELEWSVPEKEYYAIYLVGLSLAKRTIHNKNRSSQFNLPKHGRFA
jgi:hypothetical protein